MTITLFLIENPYILDFYAFIVCIPKHFFVFFQNIVPFYLMDLLSISLDYQDINLIFFLSLLINFYFLNLPFAKKKFFL